MRHKSGWWLLVAVMIAASFSWGSAQEDVADGVFLVTGAFGGTNEDGTYSGEVSGIVSRLEDVEEEIIYGRYVYTGLLPLPDGRRAQVVTALVGVGPLNSIAMVSELYRRYGDDILVHLHGGINGGYHEVGSSSVPSRVCYVDSFFNYPVLAPQPIWVEEGETLSDLMTRLNWTEEEVEIALERNPGKLVEDPDTSLPAMQIVSPQDTAWDDQFMTLGATLYLRNGETVSMDPSCLDLSPELHALAVEAAALTDLPALPESIAEFISSHGRDPADADIIHVGSEDDAEVLCGGNTFFASPVESWRQREIWGCDGVDMETPFVAWQTASETNNPQPELVVFRTSSDPPINNPGVPNVTATEYLADPGGSFNMTLASMGGVFSLPVVEHQTESYARFVEQFISLYLDTMAE